MPGIPSRVQPCPLFPFVHHPRNVSAGQSTRLNLPVPFDRLDKQASRDARVLEPPLNNSDWASIWVAAERHVDFSPRLRSDPSSIF